MFSVSIQSSIAKPSCRTLGTLPHTSLGRALAAAAALQQQIKQRCICASSSGPSGSMAAPTTHLTVYTKDPTDMHALMSKIALQDFQEPVAFTPTAPSAPASGFNGHLYMQHLTSSPLGQVLLTTPEISSTQDFLRAHQLKLPKGTVVTAEKQVSGRGRGGNQWTSPAGCLMFTASRVVSIQGDKAPFINYVVCLGVLRGIRDAVATTCPEAPPLNIRIKWPNDIYAVPPAGDTSGAVPLKIGGALMHTTWSGGGFNLLMGVGLNVSNRHPTTCINQLLEQALPGQQVPEVAPELLLARVISRLDEVLQVFEQQGFGALEADYLSSWMHSGQKVMFERHADQSVADPGVQGVQGGAAPDLVALEIQGLSHTGFMLAVETDTGRQFELTPDGNSFDMMTGLIRKKVGIV